MRLIVMSRARTSRARADHLTKVVNTEQNLLMGARGAINQPIARKLSCIYTRLFLFTFQRQLGIVLVIGIEISDILVKFLNLLTQNICFSVFSMKKFTI